LSISFPPPLTVPGSRQLANKKTAIVFLSVAGGQADGNKCPAACQHQFMPGFVMPCLLAAVDTAKHPLPDGIFWEKHLPAKITAINAGQDGWRDIAGDFVLDFLLSSPVIFP